MSYRREYESVRQNLNIVDERGNWIRPGMMPPEPFEGEAPEDLDIENMMFVDNEVYTVDLENAIIIQIFGHGNESGEFDPAEAANEIINSYGSDTAKITNLYLGGYSFKYKYGRSIVIINNENISSKLRKTLLETIILFLFLEVVIFIISKLMTGWITKPAREAFDKQRDFIADASHELKTPLAVIMASSDELVADESNRRYVENIKYESERMNKLITGLLDLSKLEAALGYRFRHQAFLRLALTHPSCGPQNNQRLEFLGDAVLQLAMSDIVFHAHPEEEEGGTPHHL